MENNIKILDFSNRQNRDIHLEDISEEYLNYIKKTTKEDPWYPSYHIAPHCGLLNDPNGLCQIDGVYHIFYQWYPIGPVHGLKYWYHLSTVDFINYEDHGVEISPVDSFDEAGCYTGMTLLDEGVGRVYYTGIKGSNKQPSICYATLDGNHISNKKMLIDYDPTLTTLNFRDPCVFKKNNHYIMLVGGEGLDNKGIFPVYVSENPYDFSYKGNLKLAEYDYGYMLECPNYYESEGKGILFFSPQGIQSPNKYDFRNVFSVLYSIGEPINEETLEFNAPTFYEMDKGFDFYAPQVFQDEKGRYILYGWLGNSKCEYPSDKNNWAHMLTIPRCLTIEEDFLIQEPLEDLKQLRQEGIKVDDVYSITDSSFEFCFEANQTFEVKIQNDEGEGIVFASNGDEYTLDRSKMTYLYNEGYGNIRYAKRLMNTKHEIRVFVDRSSIEIFCDQGKTVFTGRFYIDNISIMKISGIEGTLYQLKSNNYK